MSTRLRLPNGCTIQGNRFILSEEIEKNIININGDDLVITNIIEKGGNSYILLLSKISEDIVDSVLSLVMKICKFYYYENTRLKRFNYEIAVLTDCKKKNIQNIIEIFDSGEVIIKKRPSSKSPLREFSYKYYLMEYAEQDLTNLIENKRLELIDKIELCITITKAFIKLHSLKYFHRDIKSDNILFCNGNLKIGDLGLAAHQDEEKSIDIENEKIGPYGWLSPEVMNKVLTEKKKLEFSFDCKIDFKSDIFQLGKMFWYVFQSNLPIGNLHESDFEIKDNELFVLINNMLKYSKQNRPELLDIERVLLSIHAKHSIPK